VIAWFARNPVAANLLMWLIVAAGLVTAPSLRQEIFPEIKMGMVAVTVAYPGASAEEVEEAICVRVEEAIHDLEGVKRVTATAREGLGTIAAELVYRADGRKVLDEIKARVDAIDNLPEEAKRPVVVELESFKNVIDVAVAGRVGEEALKRLGEAIRDEISALPGVSHVELANARPYEISIEVSERELRRRGLSFDRVLAAVRSASLDLSGGNLKTAAGEILLRTRSQARRGREFEDLVLLTRPDGTRLHLGDVARVVDGFADTRQAARFDGVPAVLVKVFRAGNERVMDIAGAVRRYVEDKQASLPAGVGLSVWRDESVPLRARRDLMLKNGAYGLVLVLLVLSLFLRPRVAFWVAMGIPLSFLGAIALMPSLDVSVNVVSLVAFIVALGLIVDDAIVVGDSVARREAQSGRGVEAATRGARAVAIPVTVAALTSMVMLVPVLFVGGIGQQGHPLPKIVIACLAFSLVEALWVLPAHLAHGRGEGVWVFSFGLQPRVSRGLERFVEQVYRPSLVFALHHRETTLAAGFALLAITTGLLAGGWIRFTFLPEAESDYVAAVLSMPEGTPAAVMQKRVRHLEQTAARLREELDAGEVAPGRSAFRHVFTSLGSQPEKRRQSFFAPLSWNSYTAPHLAEVQIGLVPREERRISTGEIAGRWRELAGEIPDAVELGFPTALYSAGDRLNVQLAGSDPEPLESAAEALRAALGRYAGVRDVATSARHGKRELRLEIRPEAQGLGLSAADLARQVRQGFHGEEAQRAQRGRDDVPIVVRYPERERRSLADLDHVTIRTRSGAELPFWAVATADLARGPATVQRADRKRTIRVTADVDPEVANENEIVASLEATALPRILADHPGVTYTLEGHQRQQADFIETLRRGYAIGLVAVFALLAIPLRSYVRPLFIMLAVPFGWVGAVLGHGVLGLDVTMFTLIGIVGVTGVVVNDTLVLLYAVGENRDAGQALVPALEHACVTRFRPILLTTLTTFFGLTPILLERSTYAQDLKPMAIALAFGELISTAVILLLVPAAYAAWEGRLVSGVRQQAVMPESRHDHRAGGAAQRAEAGLRPGGKRGVGEDEVGVEAGKPLDQRHGQEV
jgi:multidrug efflux pump subunit AcrB